MGSPLEKEILLRILKSRRILVDEVQAAYGVVDDVLDKLLGDNRDFITVNGRMIIVDKPLELALKLLDQGVSVKRVSEALEWRDFEKLASTIMSGHGYIVETNVFLSSPVRFEIDVVGVDPVSRLGILVDCKHWSHNTRWRLIEAGARQIERLGKLISHYEHVRSRYRVFDYMREAIPLILTLQTPVVRVYENVLYVSIREFNDFLNNIRYVIESFNIRPVKLVQERDSL
ncbi:restriction endonuclease [Desulfurococcus amylolyticus]|uniref:Restriction endonuclease type IV Mrr domain-containing protein n=1 Tax=Desulfurococcus amylolyticus DSM 16532 TaxID=768672 RepID=I3XRB4_DESAM|nr:restriction endonuclease [Desulfurococcus amylolyticus]AFL66488.1 hypothetical protein Desfe_0587 [Desulfurococcus amylolyticus DSM 16532]